METHKLPIPASVLILGILISCNLGLAEEAPWISQIKEFYDLFPQYQPGITSGHYEYNSRGVPLLGLVIRSQDDPPPSESTTVNFQTCSNKTIEVEFKLLKPVARKCSIKNPGDPVRLTPLIKTESEPNKPMVKFQGQTVDLTKLPNNYKKAVAKAKPGDRVGYAFTDQHGSKRAVFLTGE